MKIILLTYDYSFSTTFITFVFWYEKVEGKTPTTVPY